MFKYCFLSVIDENPSTNVIDLLNLQIKENESELVNSIKVKNEKRLLEQPFPEGDLSLLFTY